MKYLFNRFGFIVTLALVCVGFIGLMPRISSAQSPSTKLVLLNVPGGGTEVLAEELSSLDNIELERQKWFLSEIQSRGFKPKGIMKRPDDIKWLMQGAELDYILFLAAESDTAFTARLVGPEEGEPVHAFDVDRSSEGLSEAGARAVKEEVGSYLDEQRRKVQQQREREQADKQAPEVAQLDGPDEPNDDPNALKKQAAEGKEAAMAKLSTDWLTASVRGNAIRRDFYVAGANEAVLSYTSVFYPGFTLDLEAFPLGMSNPEYAGIGFYANYTQGFDSVTVFDDAGDEALAGINHMELEGGVLYQLGDALALRDSSEAKFDLAIGVRHGNYAVAENPSLPSVSHTAFVLGARVTRPAFSDRFKIRAGASISPIGFYGSGAELFGETSHTYGFGADLGGIFQATEDLGISLGYEFGLQRTIFTGEGEAEFLDANVFELVQGLTGGLSYQY